MVVDDSLYIQRMLPPRSGIELVRQIRGRTGPCGFAHVMLPTGRADRKLVRMAPDRGADPTMTRPVPAQAVYRTFARLRQTDRTFVQTSRSFGPDRRRKSRPDAGRDKRTES